MSSANTSVTYTLNLNSNVRAALVETEKAALNLDSTMRSVNDTFRMFGLGFAGAAIIETGKSWIEGASDIEKAMLRIRNVSSNVGEGIRNNMFIRKEVDDLKIGLQETTDAYGNFLVKIQNSGLASEEVRKLHDEILKISKITAAPQGKMDAAVADIGIMLGEGVLEARHLRALAYVMPQIIPFLAKDMGLAEGDLKHKNDSGEEETATQQLSHLISSGKLTKAGVASKILLQSIEEYYDSIKTKLPETLQTLESEITDTSNAWLTFKNEFVLDSKGGVVEVLHYLSETTKTLFEHKEEIKEFGGTILGLVKIYAEWRLAILAIQAPMAIVGFFSGEYTRLTGALGLYSSAASTASSATAGLAQSNEILLETFPEFDQLVSQANIEFEQLQAEIDATSLEIQKLTVGLEETTVQLDLFTEAQILNSEGLDQINAKYVTYNGILMENNGIINQNLVQMSLFTESELELSAALSSNVDLLALENLNTEKQTALLALQNEQMVEETLLLESTNALLQERSALSASKLNFGTLPSVSGITSAVVPVMIAYFATEAISQLGFTGKGDNGYEESIAHKAMRFINPFMSDKDNADELTNIQYLVDKVGSKNLYKNITGLEEGSNGMAGDLLGFLNSKIKIDEKGERNYSDSSIVAALKNDIKFKDIEYGKLLEYYHNLPDLHSAITYDGFGGLPVLHDYYFGGDKTSSSGKSKFPELTKANHLKGNSSTYVTIHIDKQIGVEKMTVQCKDNNIDAKEFQEKVTNLIIKQLTNGVNDASIIAGRK